jgi:hypothetical protein
MPDRPTDAEIDTAIVALARAAHGAGCQGGSESPFKSAIACIEWAVGRPHTVGVPYYIAPFIGAKAG